MNCPRVQELLVDLLYDELDAVERTHVTLHLETCGSCQPRWSQIRAVAGAADRWSMPPISREIAARALRRAAAEPAMRPRMLVWPTSTGMRLLLGGGAALVSLLLVAGVVSRPATLVGAAVLAVVWTVLYSAVFLIAEHPSVRGLARAALLSSGVALVLVPAMTVPAIVQACERWTGVAHDSHDSTSLALLIIVVAVGYTAAPLLAGGAAVRVESGRDWIVDGLKLSALYALLTAPAVALQCVVLPLQIMALWPMGALVGAVAAGPLGLRLGGWLRHATAK
jgi:hypothetical protein